MPSPPSVMPSPAPGYSPFDAGGSSIADDSPMGYVPASFSKVRRPPPTETPMSVFDEDDEDAPDWLGEAENALAAEDYQDDGGVYVSSADVEVLKKWADERKELQQRLAAAEHAASTREIESRAGISLIFRSKVRTSHYGHACKATRPKSRLSGPLHGPHFVFLFTT